MKATVENTCAIILAGGQGRRMNFNDKGLLNWQHKPLIQHVIDAVQPQLHHIVISANQHLDQYSGFNLPVVTDEIDGFQGPLSGIFAGIKYCTQADFVLVLPCDCPTPPANLFQRLSTAINQTTDATIAIVNDGQRQQPLFGLYNTCLLKPLEIALQQQQNRVMQFINDHHAISVDYAGQAEAFKNFNQPEDMQ